MPLREGVRQILGFCHPRQKAIVSLIAFAGLRFITQSGLTIGDLVDFDIKELKFRKTSAIIYCGPNINLQL